MELDTSDANMSHNSGADGNNLAAGSNGNSTTTNGLIASSQLKSSYDTDVVRIIGQYLVNLGLKQTVESLIEESGLSGLDHSVATKFQQHILAGDWDKANSLVDGIVIYTKGDKKSNTNDIRRLIAEQKFLELIEDNQHIKALRCLRSELTPTTEDIKRVQLLSTLLMCRKIEEVRQKAQWPGKGLQSRQALVGKIQSYLPPIIMLPPNRLNSLLSQAIQLQHERCTLHLESATMTTSSFDHDRVDLKTDHVCSAENFPLQSKQELDNHKTEVWICKFSNDGTKLATGGLEGKVKIWDVDPNDKKLVERCTFDNNSYSISCLSWSPNDVYLLVCGSEDKADIWLWNVDKEVVHTMMNSSQEESFTTCSWHSSGNKFAAASIKGNFHIYDLDGTSRGCRKGLRVQCLSFLHKDPNVILAADTLNRIKSYAIKDMSLETDEEDMIEEKYPIMSFTIDKDDRHIAVNLMEQGVHLWDLKLKTLLRMFPGVCQRKFTVYSSFSSPHPTFIASGSEDGNVYIYRVDRDQPVAILCGHYKSVNCVTWNPRYPELLVSASDDRSVRLWAPSN